MDSLNTTDGKTSTAEEGLASAGERVERIVATVEGNEELLLRLEETCRKLVEAEAQIAKLSAAAEPKGARTTVTAGMNTMLTKLGAGNGEAGLAQLEAGSLDAALSSLSIEQRFAVKAELLRSGMLA